VDTPDGGALAARYDVTATPTLIFLGADHGEISRQVGAQSLADVRRALEHAYGLECASLPRAAGTGT
jgi:hypothetical protein